MVGLGAVGSAPERPDEVEIVWLDAQGTRHHTELTNAAAIAFEQASPLRGFPSFHGQRNAPGLFWSVTTGRHLLGEPDPVLVVNLRWLGGYRHPRYGHPQTAAALLEVFRPGRELLAGVCEVGDPIAVLPVAYHLLWQGVWRPSWPSRCTMPCWSGLPGAAREPPGASGGASGR